MSAYLGLFIMWFWWGIDTNGGTSYNPGVYVITAFSVEIFLSGLGQVEGLDIRKY